MAEIDEIEKPEKPAALTKEQVRQRRNETIRRRIREKRQRILSARVPHRMEDRALAQVPPRQLERYVARREGVAKKITERSMRPGADVPKLRGLAERVYGETAETVMRYPAARRKYRSQYDPGALMPSAPPKAPMGEQREARVQVSEAKERKAIGRARRRAAREDIQRQAESKTETAPAPKVSPESKARIKERLAKFRKGRGGPAGLMGAALGGYVVEKLIGGKNGT